MAFEYTPSTTPTTQTTNLLIFIGGLSDGLLTVPYTTPLAATLPPNWSLTQPLLSSSYFGWGTSSLQKDVSELAQCVTYFRSIGKTGKIVLMGHSTGCQDVMEYLVGKGREDRPKIDGGILQAGVSDREALEEMDAEISFRLHVVRDLVEKGKGDEILSLELSQDFYGKTPVSADRFLSLADRGGSDDYFSTDLTDRVLEKSFGSMPEGTGFCILFSGADEYVGKAVDRKALVEKWLGFVRKAGGKVDGNSGVVEGASHNLKGNPEEVVNDLVGRVKGFLEGLE